MEKKQPRQKMPGNRLSREDWISRALEAIGTRGSGWMSIQNLVSDLGVTKGSFFWHFESRDDFISSLLEFWIEQFSAQVAQQIDDSCLDAKGKLLLLMESISNHQLARLDIAMRAWALKEQSVAEGVEISDTFRMKYVRGLFEDMGFQGDDLEMRLRTFVIYYSFDAGFSEVETQDERNRRLKLRHKMLTTP